MSTTAAETPTLSREGKVQTLHGRTMPVHEIYPLPVDSEEHSRLDTQHEAARRTIGGLYAEPELVREILAPKEGYLRRIIDVGTGSGAWAIDMAKEFPHCEVIGIDLSPPTLLPTHPPNLRFEAGDINRPLAMGAASVDLIHARFIDHGIRSYPAWLSEAARLLRSGGIYLLLAGRMHIYDEHGVELPITPIGTAGYTGLQAIFSALTLIRPPGKRAESYDDSFSPLIVVRHAK